jgi:inner membrane protein
VDNLTHSLAGMLVADAVCAWRREARPHVRAAAALTSALANNLPDVDLAYAGLAGPKPLGYLLHHRGHTHTLLLGLPLGWLLGSAIWRWFRRRHPGAGTAERQLLWGLALSGPPLHLLLDFGNTYGVHPLWPVYSGWLYGDSIFIVEPLWLALAIPCVCRGVNERWLLVLLWSVLGATLVVCWFVPLVASSTRFMLIFLSLASSFVAARVGERARSTFALGACATVAALFQLGASRAKAEVEAAVVSAFPALTVHDIATTPRPGNPWCWEALLAGEQGGTYRVLRASVALAPLEGPRSCDAGADAEPTADVSTLSRPMHGGVRWINAYQRPVAELAELRRSDCRFRALLRFARMPYVAASGRIAGDLRYDSHPGFDFSDVALDAAHGDQDCPRFVPGWLEPRAELFQP